MTQLAEPRDDEAQPDRQGQAIDGLYIGAVSAGPADRAGRRRGDIVTRIDGQAVNGPASLVHQTRRGRLDVEVTLDHIRVSRAATATVSPVTRP